ncbi:glycosyltransferase [Rheinheimera sp.]|uniref:glycosyltransferase n=1 Tax=Rheinheimera sp. TaxID=1869214 RepID=UPI00307E0D47
MWKTDETMLLPQLPEFALVVSSENSVSCRFSSESELVSIYIPTRNRPDFLRRAVASCLSQSYQTFEVIIVDDCSDEAFRSEIEAVAAMDARIKLYRLDTPSGACVARNAAISAAQGRFITGLDDDDEFLSWRLEHFVSEWRKWPVAAFLCSGYEVVTSKFAYCFGRKSAELSPEELLMRNSVGNQLFTMTEYLRSIGGFDPAFRSCQDYDCWIRLSQVYGAGRRLASCSYRLRQDHQSERISDSAERQQGYQLLLERYGNIMNGSQRRAQKFYWYLNTQEWRSLRLLTLSGAGTFNVALKNIALRHFPCLARFTWGGRR